MKRRTKVKDKNFILDKRKDPEGYSGSFFWKKGVMVWLAIILGKIISELA